MVYRFLQEIDCTLLDNHGYVLFSENPEEVRTLFCSFNNFQSMNQFLFIITLNISLFISDEFDYVPADVISVN